MNKANDTRRMRLENFSDGVMAIAITLLALELTVPHIQSHDIIESAKELIPLIPMVLTFILSFGTIAIFWVNHHQLTQHMTSVKRRITWMNMLFLLFQAMIPFATIAAAENYANPLSVMTYSLVLFGASLSFSMLRYFIHPRKSLAPQAAIRSYIGPIVYALAIIVAPITVWASYAFLILPPLYYFLPRKGSDSE